MKLPHRPFLLASLALITSTASAHARSAYFNCTTSDGKSKHSLEIQSSGSLAMAIVNRSGTFQYTHGYWSMDYNRSDRPEVETYDYEFRAWGGRASWLLYCNEIGANDASDSDESESSDDVESFEGSDGSEE